MNITHKSTVRRIGRDGIEVTGVLSISTSLYWYMKAGGADMFFVLDAGARDEDTTSVIS